MSIGPNCKRPRGQRYPLGDTTTVIDRSAFQQYCWHHFCWERSGVRKAGSNWVDGERFFDREVELEILAERVREGTHTLLTAQRRMGKTVVRHVHLTLIGALTH